MVPLITGPPYLDYPVFDIDYAKSTLKSARLTAGDKQRNTVSKLVQLTSEPQNQ